MSGPGKWRLRQNKPYEKKHKKDFAMIEDKFNRPACEALNDLLETCALELRIELCNDIVDKIMSGDDFSDEELLDYVRSFHALRRQFETILKGRKDE